MDPAVDAADRVQVTMHDPNTGKDRELAIQLAKYEGEAVHKLAAKELIDKSNA